MLPYSDVEFCSYAVYSPRGNSTASERSRSLRAAVKVDGYINAGMPPSRIRAIPALIDHLVKNATVHPGLSAFGANTVLVPAPRSSLMKAGSVYPSRLICEELLSRGMGREIVDLLVRVKAVPKAAFQASSERPTVETHLSSIDFEGGAMGADHIVIVDDIITRGTMLYACATKILSHMSSATVSTFGLIRTISYSEVTNLIDPARGVISFDGQFTRRIP